MSNRVRLESIVFGFGVRKLADGIDLCVNEGEMVVISGCSGSGKSTLLEICAGLIEPHRGTIFWRERDIRSLSLVELTRERRGMGFLFQRQALISNLTLFENVALPLRYHLSLPDRQLRDRVMTVMRRFAIDNSAALLPEQVSLGEARMAAYSRAVIMEPDLLLLDEPTGGVDPARDAMVYASIQAMCREQHVTIIIASHSRHIAQELHCAELTIADGRLSRLNSGDNAQPSEPQA
jgi:phospholipid/cholesterol/gamma-HCH transport system ATP-binding protein